MRRLASTAALTTSIALLSFTSGTPVHAAAGAQVDQAPAGSFLPSTVPATTRRVAVPNFAGGAPVAEDLAQERSLAGLLLSRPEADLVGARSSHLSSPSPTALASLTIPKVKGWPVTTANPGFAGFNGVNHRDQRLAGSGAYANTQFSLEPPDQALCVGNGFVLEGANTAFRVHDVAGHPLTAPTAYNQFLGLTPELNRITGVVGDFTSDPKCYYDSDIKRWFMTILVLDDGHLGGRSWVFIATSQTADPTGTWNVTAIDATNDGHNGTPSDPGCPCFGDQPLIGADANGFYVSTNEFGAGFNGAQIYAMSKRKLANGTLTSVSLFNNLPLAEGISYSVQPATTPAGADYARARHGTEYFLSALQFGPSTFDNRIAVWALTNTSSLDNPVPTPALTNAIIRSEVYGQPGSVDQRPGDIPLGDLVGDALEQIQSNDDRMNQAVYANGRVWGALNTLLQTEDKSMHTGVAWFSVDVEPENTSHALHAKVEEQGYVAVKGNNVLFPAVALNARGQAALVFTLVGPDYYPSAAYVSAGNGDDLDDGDGAVHLAAAGLGPDDGFTGYPDASGLPDTAGRWGDYSAATVDADGNIWMATEYIGQTCTFAQFSATGGSCGGTRTLLANWGTFVGRLSPRDRHGDDR